MENQLLQITPEQLQSNPQGVKLQIDERHF
jgi:hypothetical protein